MKKIELRETRAPYFASVEDLIQSKEPVVIERDGKPVGAFMPIELYQHSTALSRNARFISRAYPPRACARFSR